MKGDEGSKKEKGKKKKRKEKNLFGQHFLVRLRVPIGRK
jgi:hypothetical protein